MPIHRNAILGLAAAGLAATAVFAGSHAQTPAQQAAKARQAHMQLYAHNLGPLGAMAKGEMEFDAQTAQAAASNLAALASLNQGSYWHPDSSTMDLDNTRALPAIWEDTPDVIAKAQALADATRMLADNAGSLDGVRANIGAVGGACGACHKAYRQPES